MSINIQQKAATLPTEPFSEALIGVSLMNHRETGHSVAAMAGFTFPSLGPYRVAGFTITSYLGFITPNMK